jgi:hypothetical protein
MTQNYGGSFAQRLIDQGQFDEAVESANTAIARDADDPEPLVDRAMAYLGLDRFADAVGDLEAALKLDVAAQVLETDFVDDTLFTALLGDARKLSSTDRSAAVARLSHYSTIFPRGRHAADVTRFTAQLRGERDDSPIVKERDA